MDGHNIVPHHVFIVGSLVATLKTLNVLRKVLSFLLGINVHVHFESIKACIKDMYFDRHTAAHFGVLYNHCLNRFNEVLSFVICKEDINYFNKTDPCIILLCSEKL